MASRSSSTPSEGEIVESDTEKATTRSINLPSTSVDRQSRKPASVSRSPSPIQSPRFHRSRTHSRSPYREPRGAKRSHEHSEYPDRRRDDPRQFKVRYEDRHLEGRHRPRNPYEDLERLDRPGPQLRYDDHGPSGRPRDKKRRTRSRSPRPFASVPDQSHHSKTERRGQPENRSWDGPKYHEGRSRLSHKQSVSDRGHSPVAAANHKQEAEITMTQNQSITVSRLAPNISSSAEYVPPCGCLSPLMSMMAGIRLHSMLFKAMKEPFSLSMRLY